MPLLYLFPHELHVTRCFLPMLLVFDGDTDATKELCERRLDGDPLV